MLDAVKHYLLDTDIYSLFLRKERNVVESVSRHAVNEVALTIITVQEIWGGWSAALAKARSVEEIAYGYRRLTETIHELKTWRVETFPAAAIERFHSLKKQRLNVGANDLKIAAIALEAGAVVVTRNLRDFQGVPGLSCEDWTKAESIG